MRRRPTPVGEGRRTWSTGFRPAPRVLQRCDTPQGFGARAIGAWIVARRTAVDLTVCGCCSDVIEPGTRVAVVELRGERLIVCADCAGPE
jgi:hypothetical protein